MVAKAGDNLKQGTCLDVASDNIVGNNGVVAVD